MTNRTARRQRSAVAHARTHAHRLLATGAICTGLLFAGCDRPSALQPEPAPALAAGVPVDAAQETLLRSVRRATARFHSTTQALRAGYEPSDHCVAVRALGGMGYHWTKPLAQIDGVFDPLEPEALLYGSKTDGKLQLIGVEYIVRNVGQAHPTFAGRPFDVGGVGPLTRAGVAHWSLHVWLYEENPAGIFAPFNPNVTCP